MTDAIKMQLSAFVDGELSDAETELLIRRLSRDPELRELAARYQAIGRVMRAETEPAGMGELLERVRAGISDESDAAIEPETAIDGSRNAWFKPAAGFAVAASVVAVTLFGMTPWSTDTELSVDASDTYTVPNPDPDLQELHFHHQMSSGAPGARLAGWETLGEVIEDPTADDEASSEDDETGSTADEQ